MSNLRIIRFHSSEGMSDAALSDECSKILFEGGCPTVVSLGASCRHDSMSFIARLEEIAEASSAEDIVWFTPAYLSGAGDAQRLVRQGVEALELGAELTIWDDVSLDAVKRSATLGTPEVVPSFMCSVGLLKTSLADARGIGGPVSFLVALMQESKTFVSLEADASTRWPAATSSPAALNAPGRGQDAQPTLRKLRELGTLASEGLPGWASSWGELFSLELGRALHDPSISREALAEGLLAIETEFLPRLASVHTQRSKEILKLICNRDLPNLQEALRLRVLVAGHDLKFIDFVYSYLPEAVEVREDLWPSERKHDASSSRELLAWADVIWVEWLAYCAAWYSQHKNPDQVLIIRQHRYELRLDVGDEVNYDNVDAVIAIAVHTLELIHERFGVPRELLRVIPNIYEPKRYLVADGGLDERQYSLALVGSVPRWKGLHRALEVIARLREKDSRYTLSLFGKRPEELPWVLDHPEDRAYYEACRSFIEQQGLQDVVKFVGWADLRLELRDYGYVLSTSDFEGSHVSPGEAYLVGNAGLFLRWTGSEFVYPSEFGFDSPKEMAEFIATEPLRRTEFRDAIARAGENLASQQGVVAFLGSVGRLLQERFQ